MRFKAEVSVGDVLTSMSVLIALVGALLAVRKDRAQKSQEYADRIRRAASQASAGLERWKQIVLGLYDDIQVLLVETDVKLVTDGDASAARDHLWVGLWSARSTVLRRVLEEKIELAYVDLFAYDRDGRARYQAALEGLRTIDVDSFHDLLQRLQDDVLAFADGPFLSPQLGNRLRETAGQLRAEFDARVAERLSPLQHDLYDLISRADRDLVAGQRLPERTAATNRTSARCCRPPAGT